MNEYRINLDVTKRPAPWPVVYLGQGDANGTVLVVDVTDGGEPLDLTGLSARFAMRLPDSATYYAVEGTVSGSTATFEVDETYAASVAGRTEIAYVEVYRGTELVCSTNRFDVVVLESAQEGADPSTSYSNGIIEATERAIEAAEAAEGVVLDAVPLMGANVRGGAKLGSGLSISDGALNVDLPTMGSSTKGGAKLGSGLQVSSDVLAVKATTDAQIDSAVADGAPAGDESLSTSGLSRFVAKIKAWARGAFAELSHTHAASDVTSGTLAVARGGTGVATAAEERARLGLGSTTGALPVANGGTGSATADAARTALGAASASSVSNLTSSVTDLATMVGDVDVATDGDLQEQIDALGDSVAQLDLRQIEKIRPQYWGTVSATSGGFDLGFVLSSGYTVFYSINFATGKFNVLLDNPSGTRVFNKGVVLS